MKQFIRKNLTAFLCALAVMAVAAAVRLPAAELPGLSEEQREAYTTESGIPYLTDPDSYFHTRITDNSLKYGAFSAEQAEDGTLRDTQSNYPEGRSASYQPGIVKITEMVWRTAGALFHMDLYAVEYWMPALFAALAALAAFILGKRAGRTAGGFTAGILVSCASSFAARVLPGRFDTDMFTAVMDVLLILTMTEALRAAEFRKRLAASAGFALTVVAYSWCWSVYAFMFSLLTAAGGAVFLIFNSIIFRKENRKIEDAADRRPGPKLQAWLFCVIFMGAGMLLTGGISFFRQLIRRILWAGSMTESGVMPNLLGSVTELDRPAFAPSEPAEWFVSYVPGKTLTILNGVGGAAVAILCLGGILLLVLQVIRLPQAEKKASADGRKNSLLYLCVLGTWLAGCLYASGQGIRFVEHLAVPVGILAGFCTGWITPEADHKKRLSAVGKAGVTILICAAAAALPVVGAVQISRQNRPSVSDALSEGMKWIQDHAEDPDAVIASWWDLGYFYEYESGHPALWDGGSQSGVKAILIARALTDPDMQMSQRILQMLAAEGAGPVNRLTDLAGEEKAFAALWETLPLDREETAAHLRDRYSIEQEEAEELAGMIHPQQKKETYLVISGDMLYKLGWIEYYADWDFNGRNTPPAATVYSVMPDGSANMKSDKEEARAFFAARAQETIWKLFFKAEGAPYFTPVFETSDGVSQIQVWRVEYQE